MQGLGSRVWGLGHKGWAWGVGLWGSLNLRVSWSSIQLVQGASVLQGFQGRQGWRVLGLGVAGCDCKVYLETSTVPYPAPGSRILSLRVVAMNLRIKPPMSLERVGQNPCFRFTPASKSGGIS